MATNDQKKRRSEGGVSVEFDDSVSVGEYSRRALLD
jgi:hypothetical protein